MTIIKEIIFIEHIKELGKKLDSFEIIDKRVEKLEAAILNQEILLKAILEKLSDKQDAVLPPMPLQSLQDLTAFEDVIKTKPEFTKSYVSCVLVQTIVCILMLIFFPDKILQGNWRLHLYQLCKKNTESKNYK